MTHELKVLPAFFDALALYKKTFELRKNDRNYQVHDQLILKEWDGNTYTGRELVRYISYIYHGTGEYGLEKGYCILGLKRSLPNCVLDREEREE